MTNNEKELALNIVKNIGELSEPFDKNIRVFSSATEWGMVAMEAMIYALQAGKCVDANLVRDALNLWGYHSFGANADRFKDAWLSSESQMKELAGQWFRIEAKPPEAELYWIAIHDTETDEFWVYVPQLKKMYLNPGISDDYYRSREYSYVPITAAQARQQILKFYRDLTQEFLQNCADGKTIPIVEVFKPLPFRHFQK